MYIYGLSRNHYSFSGFYIRSLYRLRLFLEHLSSEVPINCQYQRAIAFDIWDKNLHLKHRNLVLDPAARDIMDFWLLYIFFLAH